MTAATMRAASPLRGLITTYARLETRLQSLDWLKGASLLAIRLWLAQFFFLSGLTKIKSWASTVALFKDEYHVPLLPPELAAYMSAAAELSLPVLLVISLFSRLAALGLFAMTLVIELFVYPGHVTGLAENYYIMLLSGAIIAHGSGLFGADYWIATKG